MKYKDLWDHLNKIGANNYAKNCCEPWDFVWGENDMSHIKRACATVMVESYVDKWLSSPNPAFKCSPIKAIENGEHEEVYLAIYQLGVGEFN